MDNLSDIILGGIAQFIENLNKKKHQLTKNLTGFTLKLKKYNLGKCLYE